MIQKDIQNEINSRVEFKINEILNSIENQAKTNWNLAFIYTSYKHQHYYEAFNQLKGIVKKEIELPVPYDEMYKKNINDVKDKYIQILSDRLLKRGVNNYQHELKFIVKTIEEILNLKLHYEKN